MKQTPKNDSQCIEKIYRIRQYLLNPYGCRDLSLEQIISQNKAEQILVRIQQSFWA